MDCYLTSPFMTSFPDKLKEYFLKPDNCFDQFYKSISNNNLRAGTDLNKFVELLESLKASEHEIFKAFSDLEAAGKLKTNKKTDEIPDSIRKLHIRKSVLKTIGSAFSQEADMVMHDGFEKQEWKNNIMIEGGKPVIDNSDMESGRVAFLFSEKSDTLEIGDQFSWSQFLSPYIYPFKNIRILDPYLYANFRNIRFRELIRILSSKSKNGLIVEIISDSKKGEKYNRNSKSEKDLMDEVISSISENVSNSIRIKLYTQKTIGKDLFHARVLWTDFWNISFERGFDFLVSDASKSKVKWQNDIFITGKYASNKSTYHKISDNWNKYLEHANIYHVNN